MVKRNKEEGEGKMEGGRRRETDRTGNTEEKRKRKRRLR